MKISVLMMAAAILVCGAGFAGAETWNIPGSGTWNDAGSWDPASIPNAVGATAIFNSASGPNRTVSTDLAGITVGTISYAATDAITQTTSVTAGTGGSLIFDNGGSGVTITTSGTGTGNLTISAPTTFNENVTANVNQTAASSAAGSLNLTATITGTGGFTKNGDAMATFGTGNKTYAGPTEFNGGRMRISNAARPQSTSSFRINSGAGVEFITAGTFTLGPGSVFLNGTGPSGGPQAVFPGAIRPSRITGMTTYNITNDVVLESATLVHQQGFVVDDVTQTLQFSGVVSGGSTASLSISGLNSDQNLGRILLTGANTYSGGSIVNGGRLEVSGSAATFGVGDILLHNPANVMTNGAGIAAAISRLVIPSGVSNAIDDLATVTIESGNRAFADLGGGIDDAVGSLVLGGTTYTTAGTYGGMTSGADFQFSDFFAGAGVLRILDTGLAGDHNGDGAVDAADYVAWRKTPGDFGGDPGGYDTWVENFGEPNGGGGGGGVPEPTTLVLLGWLAPAALAGRRRRT